MAVSGRRAGRLEETVRDIESHGGSGFAVPCDVSQESQIASAVDQVVNRFGSLDVAVAIVDANDLGTHCIGAHPKRHLGWNTSRLAESLTQDNPSGQSREQTPVILGRMSS